MRKLLFILLLLPVIALGQNTTTLPSGTTSITPQFRKEAVTPDSLSRIWMNKGTGWNRLYNSTELNVMFRDVNSVANSTIKAYADSLTENINANVLDVFLVAGQSNADGRGDSTKSVYAVDGTFQYFNSLKKVFRNVGSPSSRGSFGPSFANEYYRITGRHVLFVDAAVGGAAQTVAADNGTDGNWDTTGTRFNNAVTMTTNALAAAQAAGYTTNFKGVIWCQGEQDGRKIDEGVITKAIYKAALVKMIGRFRAIYGQTMPFIMSRIGYRNGEADSGYVYVQEAQEEVCFADSNKNIMGFRDAGSFRDRGLFIDAVHYTQDGYSQMGLSLARAAATGVTPNPYRFRPADGNLALGRRLVATANIDLLDSTNTELVVAKFENKSLGTGAYQSFRLMNGDDFEDSFRIGLSGKNFSAGGAFGAGNAFIETKANLNNLNFLTRKSGTSFNFYVAGSGESARRFSVDNLGAWVRSGNSNGVTPNTLANTLVVEGSTNSGLTFMNSSTGSGSIYFGNQLTNDGARIQYNHPSKYMRFYTNSTEALRIDSSQNVLINTTLPALGKVDIAQGSGFALVLGATSSGTGRFNNTTKIGRIGIPNYSNSAIPFLSFLGQSTVNSNDMFLGGGSSSGYAATTIRFMLGANNTTTTGTEYGRFTSSGLRLGDGGTATATLHLKAHTTGPGTAPLKIDEQSGNMTTAEKGAFEFSTANLKFSVADGTRKRFALTNDVSPTNGQIPIGDGSYFTNGNITSTYGNSVVNGAGTIAINADTTSSTGLVSKTRLNNSLTGNNLQNVTTRGNITTNPIIQGDSVFNNPTKRIYFFGTSWVTGVGVTTTPLRHTTLVANALNLTEINLGIAGTTMQTLSAGDSSMYERRSRIPVYNSTTDAYLSFMYGINDYRSAPGNGADTATYTAQYKAVLQRAITTNGWPASRVIIAQPEFHGNASTTTNRQNWLAAFNRVVAAYPTVKVITDQTDFVNTGRPNYYLAADSLHANNLGHQRIANLYFSLLSTEKKMPSFFTYGDILTQKTLKVYKNVDSTLVDVRAGVNTASNNNVFSVTSGNINRVSIGNNALTGPRTQLFLGNSNTPTTNTFAFPKILLFGTNPGNYVGIDNNEVDGMILANKSTKVVRVRHSRFIADSTSLFQFLATFSAGISSTTGVFTSTVNVNQISRSNTTAQMQIGVPEGPALTYGAQVVTGGSGQTSTTNLSQWRFNGVFAPTTGTAAWSNVSISPVINQTGGTGGTVSALRLDAPTLTSLVSEYRGLDIRNTAGKSIVTGTAPVEFGGTLKVSGMQAGTAGTDSVVVHNSSDGKLKLVPANYYSTGSATVEISGTSQQAAINTIYIPHNAALTTITLPSSATAGQLIQVIGEGAGGFRIAQNASQQIVGVGVATTVGTGGYLESTNRYCTITLRYITTNIFSITSSQGTFTVN